MPLKRGDPPVSVRKQQQLQAEKQKQAEQQKKKNSKNAAKRGKRRGPLPLWLAEIVVLGSFGGIAALAFSAGKGGKGDEIGRSIAALLEKLIPPKTP